MNLLDEYQKLLSDETDNEFPDEMQNDGLTESDRALYEEVLSQMRSDMDKANEEMKSKSPTWAKAIAANDGSVKNKTYKMTDEMLKNKVTGRSEGKMMLVSEPIGLYVEGFRCPKCGNLMYDDESRFNCSVCGYTEETDFRMKISFIDSTYNKIPIDEQYTNLLRDMLNNSIKNRK